MSDDTLEINGWTVYAHPLFLDQLNAIIGSVENARKKDPKGYKKKRAAKLLAAVLKVAFEDIPSDPTRDIYRQGGTLGEEYKHWFRAKFLQRFRLFFRYRLTAKNPTGQRAIVAGSRIQSVGASEHRPHRCPLCASSGRY